MKKYIGIALVALVVALTGVMVIPALAQTAISGDIVAPAATTLNINQAVSFSGSATGGAAPYFYVWDFGDGTTAAGQSFIKTFTQAGTRTVTVTITDSTGAVTTASRVYTIAGETQTNPVTVELKVNGVSANNVSVATSSQFTLSWTSTNATACTASGNWTGSKAVNSSEVLTSPATTGTVQTFTLTCTGANNTSGSDTITITTASGTVTSPLVITNVRVTDVTSNSVIVRWTTNRVASSRVIFDTTSHSSISGQSSPNYGYPNTTGTSDVDTKVVEHAVTVTGLSSNTTYFFRAISQE